MANYKAFRKKVKTIVNHSSYGSTVKAQKLAAVVRGWRNYHKHCKMQGARDSLWFLRHRAFKVLNKEQKQSYESCKRLIRQAFPSVPYSTNRYINVRGDKSPFDGDIVYWSQRNSKLYGNHTSRALQRQNYSCKACGLKFIGDEKVHLHHVDKNHQNWKQDNLEAVHESCHDYIHGSKSVS